VEETKKKRKFVDDTSDASAPSPGQLTTDQVLVYFYTLFGCCSLHLVKT